MCVISDFGSKVHERDWSIIFLFFNVLVRYQGYAGLKSVVTFFSLLFSGKGYIRLKLFLP